MGSASELEYHLLLAHELSFLDDTGYRALEPMVVEVKRMLASFIDKVRTQQRSATDN